MENYMWTMGVGILDDKPMLNITYHVGENPLKILLKRDEAIDFLLSLSKVINQLDEWTKIGCPLSGEEE